MIEVRETRKGGWSKQSNPRQSAGTILCGGNS